MLSVYTSCRDDQEVIPIVPVVSKTVVDVAVSGPQFSVLVAALQKADLVSTLKWAGPLTVFAPTNDAFATPYSQLWVAGIDDSSSNSPKIMLSWRV